MSLGPLLIRELRTQSRQLATYWVRLAGAAVMAVPFLGIVAHSDLGGQMGQELFDALNLFAYYLIWIGAPLLSADCLSAEKREGTIGLLFLTSLNASEIVLAKAVVNSLKGLALLCAALPMLLLPFFLGGPSWQEAMASVLLLLGSLLAAMSAGLVVSSIARVQVRALIGALLLAGVIAFPFNLALAFGYTGQVGLLAWPTSWIGAYRVGPGIWGQGLVVASGIFVAGVALVVLSVRYAARRLHLQCREVMPNPGSLDRFLAVRTQWLGFIGVALSATAVLFWARFLLLPSSIALVNFSVVLVLWILGPCLAIRYCYWRDATGRTSLPGLTAAHRAWSPRSAEGPYRAWSLWPYVGLMFLLVLGPPWLSGKGDAVQTVSVALTDMIVFGVALLTGLLAYMWRRDLLHALVVASALDVFGAILLGWVGGRLANHPFGADETSVWLAGVFDGWSWLVAGQEAFERRFSGASSLMVDHIRLVWLADTCLLFLSVLCALGLALNLAGRARLHRRRPSNDPRQVLFRDFCQPLFAKRSFARRIRDLRQANPVHWLQQRHWTVGTQALAWCLVCVLVECSILSYANANADELVRYQSLLLWAFIPVLVFCSARSFHEEKEQGALELLLVTPLSAGSLLAARLAAIARQFLPAFLMVGMSTVLGLQAAWRPAEALESALFLFAPCAAMPCAVLIGLYLSLKFKRWGAAWVLTCCLVACVPGALWVTERWLATDASSMPEFLFWSRVMLGNGVVIEGATAVIAWHLAKKCLRNREFRWA